MDTVQFLNKRFIVTGLLVLVSVFLLGFFTQTSQVNSIFQTLLVSITFFLVLPLLYCKIILRESFQNIGWHRGRVLPGILASILSLCLALASIYAIDHYTSFREHYFFPGAVQASFLGFVLYEALLVPFTALFYEVFFRGLVQRLWLGSLGVVSVLLQTGLFFGLLYLADDLSWQRIPVILFAPFSGLIVYYSGSLWYAWGASFLFFFLTDVFLLAVH